MTAYAEVIGDPIAQSKSPVIHGFWLGKLGIAADYRRTRVAPGEVAAFLEGRRADPDWRGCNVTIPHKEAVGPHCDALDPRVAGIGAVNTVVRQADGTLFGTNTDVDGIAEAVAGTDLSGRRAVVIGAGGAARAAFAFLAGKGCAQVSVLARTVARAERAVDECRLEARVLAFEAGSGAFGDAALVINATQLGMTGQDAMPGFVLDELAGLAPNARVFDMVYAPLETGLLAAARGRGLAVSDGLSMLIGQAATAFERFFGQPPPRDRDAELRRLLTA